MIPRVRLMRRLHLGLHLAIVWWVYRLEGLAHALSDPLCARFDPDTYAVRSGRGMECRPCAADRRMRGLLDEIQGAED